MNELKHQHLMTLTPIVDFAEMVIIGQTPGGLRHIAPVTGGVFTGERLNGSVLPGADWRINRPDGVLALDVRVPLKCDDGAMIYLTYQCRFLADDRAMARFSKGALLDPSEYSFAGTAKFECGDDRYTWLNYAIAVGTGVQTVSGPIYTFFEIG